ncbi:hypothetical protein DFH94DRAFT_737849 [Russula ochroleuca]|uniref:WW domain-containing protein n=1 Tax=Russula ochroleuca TaxID=152965 RepID=A0A9P5MXC7_9AGAM|nr:hypothetical protein DFH94DRAFT_737849 [Russula ochroleuca]
MSSEELPLPYGWVQEFDPNTNHPFWVDTKADPPRAIWTHPYDDDQYLQEHPEVREKVSSAKQQESKDSPSSKPRRHSFNGQDSGSMVPNDDEASPNSKGKGKRGFFGKLKDKAIGTKEERDAYKREQERIEMERRQRHAEMITAQRARYAQEQALYNQGQYRGGPLGGSSRQRYGPPAGNPYTYGPEYGSGYGYGYGYDDYGGYGGGGNRRGRRGMGGGGLGGGLPILGALAGGLLLGDILGGGF